MYFDTVVVAGLIIVILSCAMITYVSVYVYKHIKQDTLRAEKANQKDS